ncbi:sterol desaturase family protein [Halomonas sp. NO4]|uniref:sterol desaturase family protein n=1 Tax=Halomonas sp. NO4 TaxID=2484813 RepID=UPI0013D8C325|nr:sterol desaturase family protein [Halomonas sp. NO4]
MSAIDLPFSEAGFRLGTFLAVLLIMVLWELRAPRRALTVGRLRRWPSNAGIVALDTLLVRLLLPAGAVTLGLFVESAGWGLFQWLGWPLWLTLLLSVILLDLTIWTQHVLFHAVPALWRLHRMHHADLDVDATTGLRFHPLEILISMGIKAAAVVALGAPGLAVLLFEVLLNATSLFNHGNVRLPPHLERRLRWVVVTPEMHRVHHSWHPAETNSNFGFNLPWWDRLLGTYVAQPRDGHEGMTLGLHDFRDPRWLRLDRMLLQPLHTPRATALQRDNRP